MQTDDHPLPNDRSQSLQIIATPVYGEDRRMQCLINIAGNMPRHFFGLERAIFAAMGLYCASYSGGYWDYFQLSNGGFFMALPNDEHFHMASPNGFSCDVDAETAGIIATAFAYGNLSFGPNGECFGEAYHKLSDFIFQHRNAGLIRAALD